MKKHLYIIALFISSLGFAQDVHFSQIQESPLWLNPANAGFMDGYFRAVANYRNQWASMGKAYQTMAISVDASFLKTKKNKAYLGMGLFVFNDRAGAAKMGTTQAQLHINAIIKTSKKSKLGGAVYIGFNQNSANYASLTYANQYNGKDIDNTLGSGEIVTYSSFLTSDVGAGLNYEFSSANVDMLRDDIFSIKIGGAVHHLNQPVQKFASGSTYKLPMRYVGNIQARIDIKGTLFSILPSVIYLRQATANEITVGTHVRYRFKNPTKVTGAKSETGINIGMYYRIGDAVIPQINVDMGKYAIGVAYDLNISQYRQVSKLNGGFEIYLKFMSLDDALFKRRREHGL
ncbi:MAG: PorP/SprF family type IX secretion system membrane protein [Bacteroidetes bacterium]|nr:PorP/SprF family type IX secretion system membrane protein [Bacteroidota bacterium]